MVAEAQVGVKGGMPSCLHFPYLTMVFQRYGFFWTANQW